MSARALCASALLAAASAQPRPWHGFPAVPLFNAADQGLTMPAVGLGTGAYRASSSPAPEVYPECWNTASGCGAAVSAAVSTWLEIGGPRLDCANSYDDETSVGAGIAAAKGVRREDYFILTKTGPPFPLGYNDTIAQFQGILQDLGVEYVDALLIHWPYETASQGNSTNNVTTSTDPACNMTSPAYNPTDCRLNTWRAMLHIWKSGKARSVGVSNYNISCLQEIIDAGLELPAINQVPFNLYRSSSHDSLRAFCDQHRITFNGYSPLGVPDWHSYPAPLAKTPLLDPRAVAVAQAHKISPAQALLAWQWAERIPTNPRTFNVSHMKENLAAITTVRLTHGEIATLGSAPQDTCAMDPNFYECAP